MSIVLLMARNFLTKNAKRMDYVIAKIAMIVHTEIY